MLFPLPPANYTPARSIFSGLNAHLAIDCLLDGAVPGVLYVDDYAQPAAGLARVQGRFYLAGTPGRARFSAALGELFAGTLLPQGRAAGREGFTLFYDDPAWEDFIGEVILKDLYPIAAQRLYFNIDPHGFTRPPAPPEGFQLEPVRPALLERTHLLHRDELVEELQSERESVEAFFEKSFGVCLLAGDTLAGWCLSEYNHAGRCEVGIAVAAEYRRRGLATLAGAAFLAEATRRGYRQVGWHCYSDNHGSVRTAQKLGFRLASEHPAYFASFDPVLNQAIHGDKLFELGDYAAALAWFERAIQAGPGPRWAYVEAAGACAHLGDHAAAFRYLRQAVLLGLSDPMRLQALKYLQPLHASPEWRVLLAELETQK